MFRNYLTIAWRNIVRNKVYTFINVTGLALGICACIVIYLVTLFDFSFDQFHPDKERIYRIVGQIRNAGGEDIFLNSLVPDVAGLENQVPGFEAKAAFYNYGFDVSVPDGEKQPKKFDNTIPGSHSTSIILTWPQYFDVFSYQWVQGSAQTLNEPFKVVLTENRAKKYFGDLPMKDMIGKTLIYDDSLRITVSGIVKDWTGNTDFGFTDFISVSTATHSFLKSSTPTEDWSSLQPHGSMAFVKLAKGTTAATINSRFETFIKDHVKFRQPGSKLSMWLQPLNDIHFTKDSRRGDDGDDFRKAYMPVLYGLMGIALFILIIAGVNFINLSTAQSIQRAKEIGVRKVLGSNKTNITLQFLTETFVLTLAAVGLAVLLVNPVLTLFKDYIPFGVVFHPFAPSTISFLIIVTVFTTLLAGFYPSRVLAAYLPVLSIKGTSAMNGTGKWNPRKALIVFQFTISMIFIIIAMVMGKQLNFMKDADKGFNSDAVIVINKWRDHSGKMGVFAENIRHIAGIDQVLWQGNAPMGFAQMNSTYKFRDKKNEITIKPILETGDDGYIPFYQMKLIAGRNMVHSDSLAELVVNETLARTIGFENPADAVGHQLYSNMNQQGERSYPIVGVVADFHQGSFHDAIQPAVIENLGAFKYSIAIRLSRSEKNTSDVKTILSAMEVQWKKIFPESPMDYNFMNESIGWLYGQEEKTAWLVNVAMVITIFISCMGLFGLGMFTAQKRTREIGIRKVLGAGIPDIVIMLSKDFVKLILVAIIIASPVAYYYMHQWLQDYVYRTNISWWIFAVAGLSAIFIGLITTCFQAIKAAVVNPVKSLRSE